MPVFATTLIVAQFQLLAAATARAISAEQLAMRQNDASMPSTHQAGAAQLLAVGVTRHCHRSWENDIQRGGQDYCCVIMVQK